MDAYSDYPNHVSDSDEITTVDPQAYNRFQEMIAAEKELEEKTLMDLLNEVEEELYEEHLSKNIFVHNANKLKGDET